MDHAANLRAFADKQTGPLERNGLLAAADYLEDKQRVEAGLPAGAVMASSVRHNALAECATICRDIMREEDAGARADTTEERRDINRHALRYMRYGTAKQILERIAALPST